MATATKKKPSESNLAKFEKEVKQLAKERDKADADAKKANDKLAKKIAQARRSHVGIIQVAEWLDTTRQAVYKFLENRGL